jgi:hypothetical protein
MHSFNHRFTLLPLMAFWAACSPETATEKNNGGEDQAKPDTDLGQDTGTEMAQDFEISILSPQSGDLVGGEVTVVYQVMDFTLNENGVGEEAEEGFGHVHIYVNGEYVDYTASNSYTLSDLEAGFNTIGVVLANNDHTEISESWQEVEIEVVDPLSPYVIITSPEYGTELDRSSFQLELAYDNFEISDDVGGHSHNGEGHYHIYVDGEYFDYGTDPDNAWVTRLEPGEREIMVELVNNDHTSMDPVVSDTIQVEISADATRIEILAPTYGDDIDSSAWPLEVSVENYSLSSEAFGGEAKDGEGHYHIYRDDTYLGATPDLQTWLLDMDPGNSTLTVVLAENDHIETQVRDTIRVSSPEDRPGIRIVSPPQGELVTSDFTVAVDVENFWLDDSNLGGEASEDMGHYHVYIDDEYVTLSVEETATVSGLDAGSYTLRVELVGDDHYELETPVFDEIAIQVQ